jgi:hypothetical protein
LKADRFVQKYTSQSRTFLFNPKKDQSKTFHFGPETIAANAERFYLIQALKIEAKLQFGPEIISAKVERFY